MEGREKLEVAKDAIVRYVMAHYFWPSADDSSADCWDDMMELLPGIVGPALLESGALAEEDLVRDGDEVDWSATMEKIGSEREDMDMVVMYETMIS